MSGYVLDQHAVIAGLAGSGSEHHRREVSCLLASHPVKNIMRHARLCGVPSAGNHTQPHQKPHETVTVRGDFNLDDAVQ